jgi:hypothetical protein
VNLFSRSLIAATAIALLALPASSFAQDGSPYTVATVSRAAPFGSLPVDGRNISDAYAASLVASLGTVELAELTGRCEVIVSNPWTYGLITAEFCEGILYQQGLIDADDPMDSSSSSSSSE